MAGRALGELDASSALNYSWGGFPLPKLCSIENADATRLQNVMRGPFFFFDKWEH